MEHSAGLMISTVAGDTACGCSAIWDSYKIINHCRGRRSSCLHHQHHGRRSSCLYPCHHPLTCRHPYLCRPSHHPLTCRLYQFYTNFSCFLSPCSCTTQHPPTVGVLVGSPDRLLSELQPTQKRHCPHL